MAAVLAGTNAEDAPLIETVAEFAARATSTSEVLTLNLTNLLILIVLKAIIFGAGIVFSGAGATARAQEEETSITSTDLQGGMCFLMFTSGMEDKLSCLERTACNDIVVAKQYYSAGKMWYNMHQTLGMEFPSKYMTALNAIKAAADHGETGGNCAKYQW